MTNYYKSKFYKKDIEVENIDGEILVNIITNSEERMIYSWYDLIDKTSYSPYIKNAILSSFIGNIPKNILIIGFGAGAYAKYFKDYMGGRINISGIEIDGAMIDIATKEFNLNDINYFNLDYIDALNILNKKKNNRFDTIFVDIYDNNSKIPESLNNINTLNLIKNILTPSGKLIINFANYSGGNILFYDEINNNLVNIFGKNFIQILNGKDDSGNIIGVYNLEKKYSSENLILEYLKFVQSGKINYDGNLISNIYLK